MRLFSLPLFAATLCAPLAFADVVPVLNPSFEVLPSGGLTLTAGCLNAGCFYSAGPAIPNWNFTGGSGQFRPGLGGHFTSLSDGPTSAYSNGGIISQTVVPTVQAGRTYTLLVDLGNRLDTGVAGSARLLINGNFYTASGAVPAEGTFGTHTATYAALPGDVGKSITIQLVSSGVQGNFDNVRLFAVPEPADIAVMMVISAVILGGALRRKRIVETV